jgi:hypothetical protein
MAFVTANINLLYCALLFSGLRLLTQTLSSHVGDLVMSRQLVHLSNEHII